jgi:small subunit ribosomal protein S6
MPNKATRNYETIIILDSVADEDKIEAQIQKYVAFLTKNGSEIKNIDRWGRKKFAYQIKKKHTGYYVSIEFASGPDIVAKLDRAYHLDENVLRFLTISFDKKTLGERKLYFEKKAVEITKQEERVSAEETAIEEKREADKHEAEKHEAEKHEADKHEAEKEKPQEKSKV